MNQFFLRRGELISILIALAMLFVIVIFSGLDWSEYLQNRNEVLASRQVFEHTSTLLLAVTDAETSQRGYLLSGDPAYLRQYDAARARIPGELDILARATPDDTYSDSRVEHLRALVTAKLAVTSENIERRKRSEGDAGLGDLRTGKGKELMDSIRRVADEIHGHEQAVISSRSTIVMHNSDRAHLISIASSAILLVLLGLGAVTINNATARREQLIADLDRERNQTAEVRDLLQTTLSSIGDAVLVSDSQGRITFLNHVAEVLTGWPAEEAVGRPVEDVFTTADESTRLPLGNPVAKVLTGVPGKATRTGNHTVLMRRDHSEIPIDDSGAAIRTISGEILGVVLVFRDVTSRRTAARERERLLAEAEQSRAIAEQQRSHLHSLFLQAPAMINIHRGRDHIYELAHPLTRQLLGGRDVTGSPAREAASFSANGGGWRAPDEEYLRRLDEVYRSGRSCEIHDVPAKSILPDGTTREIFLNYVFCPWREPGGSVAGVMTLAVDVTEQVRTKQEMQATHERLRETAKLESLGVLAGGIAHDFNNLLVGIMGNGSLAFDLLPERSEARRLVENVIDASEKAAALTRQMLAYSGKGRFVLTTADFSKLVAEILPLIQSSIPRTAVLHTELSPDLPPVEVDCSQLQQVIMNLVINAAEACDGQAGRVTISTARQEVDDQFLATEFGLAELKPGSYVCLEVSDNGCGMDEATRARIFDPFFTTKFTGRGLGLSAVLGTIRAHKGAIRVYSEAGLGSSFRVLIPIAERGKKIAPTPLQTARQNGGSGTILVVDDEEMVRRVARATLERYGYSVLDAANGEAAVAVFRERSRGIDAVVLDLTMPVMNGEVALGHLKSIDAGVKVILSSGFNEAEATQRFDARDLAGFLQKPYTAAKLVELVRVALESRYAT